MLVKIVPAFFFTLESLLSFRHTTVMQQLHGRIVYSKDHLIALKPSGLAIVPADTPQKCPILLMVMVLNFRSISRLFCRSINDLVNEIRKKLWNNAHYDYPEPKMTSLNVLFCSTNRPNLSLQWYKIKKSNKSFREYLAFCFTIFAWRMKVM